MQRSALIVAGAAGPDDVVNGVLRRFEFAPAAVVPNAEAAVARLRDAHYDLLVVSLPQLGPADFAALEHEIRRSGTTFVIGTAPAAEPEIILRALRSGVHEFLQSPASAHDLAGAVDRLLRRGQAQSKRGLTVAVYSAKGGLGTTSIAVNVASALARNNPSARVALADFVVSGGDVGVLLDLRPAYDVGDLATKTSRIDADLLASVLTPAAGGVWVLPASDKPEVAELVDGNVAATIVNQLRTHFPFTVLDCEHHLSDRTLAVLDAADRVLLVTQLSIAALRGTQRTLALCQRLGLANEKLLVVVNRYGSADVVTPRDAEQLLEREIFFKLPNDHRTSADAVARGVSVGEYDAGSDLAAGYAMLAAKLGGSALPLTIAHGRGQASRLGRLLGIRRNHGALAS